MSRLRTGELPRGCRHCRRGEKLVLFVTGVCNMHCFYCPLSEKRAGKEKTWANEREVGGVEQVVEEALRMQARGAGITGGDPLLDVEKTVEYSSALKEEFGSDFHLHLYTAQPAGRSVLKRVIHSGVDELRFNITEKNKSKIWESIEEASSLGCDFGVEIPAIPGKVREAVEVAEKINSLGGFLNLNELEFSSTNSRHLSARGYGLKGDESYGAEGSEEAALSVLASARENSLRVHYCTSSFKDTVQLRHRLLRTALQRVKPYEEVTEDGLLLKGVLVSQERDPASLVLCLVKKFDIPPHLIFYDKQKCRIETTPEIATVLAKLYRGDWYLVEEYPTSGRLEVEVVPLP